MSARRQASARRKHLHQRSVGGGCISGASSAASWWRQWQRVAAAVASGIARAASASCQIFLMGKFLAKTSHFNGPSNESGRNARVARV